MTGALWQVHPHWQACAEIEASPDLLQQIRFGVRIPWAISSAEMKRRFANAYFPTPSGDAFVTAEVHRWVQNGFVQEISFAEAKNAPVVRAACVVHGSKDRVVSDYGHVNDHLGDTLFGTERFFDLVPQLRPNDSLLKADLRDGYYHQGICAADKFSLTLRLRPFSQEMRLLGCRLIIYLDDVGEADRALSSLFPATPADTSVVAAEVHAVSVKSWVVPSVLANRALWERLVWNFWG